MKKIIWTILIVSIVGLVVFKLASNKKQTEDRIYTFDENQEITVSVDSVKQSLLSEEKSFTGTFEPYREVKVSAETQARVNRILVDVGTPVRSGQTIIQLDKALLELQLQAVEVQIEGLQEDLDRYTILTEADAVQGLTLEKTRLGMKSAMVQKATLEEQIHKSQIKAPFDGIVTAKLTEVGAFAAPGVPLVQITDISRLKFTVNVPEKNLMQFQEKHQYTISADAFPDMQLDAELLMVGSRASMGNNFPVQFRLDNTTKLDIKAGMFGKVYLSAADVERGILIPSSSIIMDGNKAQVYLVREKKAMLVTVTASANIGDKTLISSGLKPGDRIVTRGFINLFDGANIRIN